MRDVNGDLEQVLVGLELMILADEAGDADEFKAQALHLAEHFEWLDNALRAGSELPRDWQARAANPTEIPVSDREGGERNA